MTKTVQTQDRPSAAAESRSESVGRLLVQCEDGPGIISAVTGFLAKHGANILESDQTTTDAVGGRFFLRMVFDLENLPMVIEDLTTAFAQEVAEPHGFDSWRITQAAVAKRVAIMVSKYDHCLLDLLWRWRRGELPVDIGLVISNHPDLAPEVRQFGVPFVHIPVTKASKAQAEAEQLRLLAGNFDLVVMARYMQILSSDFLAGVGCPVINIHHSFLPAFVGASPYQQAHERGVKLIGATAHYATEDLDEGPIIEQDVIRVGHDDGPETLRRRGADVERSVLLRAVQWHCEDRVLTLGRTTVVFS
ncbi:formyltetrahydrofolate deformylase [Nocardioides sp. NPDC127514]|uniref:formyltetrahydrofolate deformylase n=1 Tax=unclassified Nocardioides TaxID=2615069 RepID=UPI003331D35B